MRALVFMLCALLCAPTTAVAITDEEVQQAYEQTVAARGARRPDIAETILRELIEARPNAGQLRFDLAVSLAEQGQCAAASRAFDIGRRLARTPSFDQAVDAAMDELCPRLAPFEVSLGLNVAYDTNANGGAGESNIIVDGVPLLLSSGAVAQEAYGYQLSGSVAYNIRLSQTSYIVPTLGFAIADNQGRELDSYSLTPGVAYRHRGDRIDWRIGPMAVYNFDHEGLTATGIGLAGRASAVLGPRTGLYFDASYLEISDSRNELRDYNQSSVSLTFVHNPVGTQLSLRAGLSYTDRDYRDDFSDIASVRLSLGISGSLTTHVGYDISYTRALSEGGTPHFMFGHRRDVVDTVALRLSFAQFEGWYGRPYLGLSHSISDSTWGTKTYDRTRLLIGFTRSF